MSNIFQSLWKKNSEKKTWCQIFCKAHERKIVRKKLDVKIEAPTYLEVGVESDGAGWCECQGQEVS